MSAPNRYAELLREIADEDWNDDPTDVVARLRTLASLLDRNTQDLRDGLHAIATDNGDPDLDRADDAEIVMAAHDLLASLAGETT